MRYVETIVNISVAKLCFKAVLQKHTFENHDIFATINSLKKMLKPCCVVEIDVKKFVFCCYIYLKCYIQRSAILNVLFVAGSVAETWKKYSSTAFY